MDQWWQALQDSSLAFIIRSSELIYPVANVTHIVGIMVFFSLVAAMDLAILHVLRGEAAAAVVARLRPAAIFTLIIVAVAGAILFAADAVALARNPAFRLKLIVIVLALANVALNSWVMRGKPISNLARLTAAGSLLLWLCVAILGRSIAYV